MKRKVRFNVNAEYVLQIVCNSSIWEYFYPLAICHQHIGEFRQSWDSFSSWRHLNDPAAANTSELTVHCTGSDSAEFVTIHSL